MSTFKKQEQCLIEKCSFGGLELSSPPVVGFQGICMNLEQVQKKSELRSRGISDGDLVMMVFNHLQQDMANEEVLLLVNYKPPPPAATTVKSSFPINSTSPPVPPNPIQKQQPHHHVKKLPADVLPMVRRSSISKFLESRKNRMMARTPYN